MIWGCDVDLKGVVVNKDHPANTIRQINAALMLGLRPKINSTMLQRFVLAGFPPLLERISILLCKDQRQQLLSCETCLASQDDIYS